VVNNGPRPVSAETRQKVLWAIEQLDYTPSTIARSLKTQKTYAIGLIISDVLNPFLAFVAKSAEDLLLARHYSLTVCNSGESAERERVWLQKLRERRVDGLILLPTGGNRSLLLTMLKAGQKLTLIDRRVEGVSADCVLIDNEGGAYEMIQHLLDLGHTRIALLNLPHNLAPGQGCLRGYRRALRDAGIPFSAQLVREDSFTAENSYALSGELLDLDPAPTALFAASNRLAEGVLRQVKARGLRLPDDLALGVFDDVPYYGFFEPSITAVAVDGRALADKAVQFVIDRIDGEYAGEPRTVHIACCLQVRESTSGRVCPASAEAAFHRNGSTVVKGMIA
jgi:DNA-binding LacI/PurR family transcriptional regulator